MTHTSIHTRALSACVLYGQIADGLRGINMAIIMHRCPDASAPEMDIGYGGSPSCIQEYELASGCGDQLPELCDNCRIVKDARDRRKQLRKDMQKVRRQIRVIAKEADGAQ